MYRVTELGTNPKLRVSDVIYVANTLASYDTSAVVNTTGNHTAYPLMYMETDDDLVWP